MTSRARRAARRSSARWRLRRPLEHIDERQHPLRLDLSVRIEEEHVRGVAPLPADIAAAAKAHVLDERDEVEREVGNAREARVARRVVDHDDPEALVRRERLDAGASQRALLYATRRRRPERPPADAVAIHVRRLPEVDREAIHDALG